MKIRYVKIRNGSGPVKVGTLVAAFGKKILFTERLSRERVAERLAAKFGKGRTSTAADLYKSWHKNKPGSANVRAFNHSANFVFLGTVPMLTYRANRTGRVANYYHKPRRAPRLYYDPASGNMILLGGSTRIKRGWMRE